MIGRGNGSTVLIHGPRGRGKTQMACDVAFYVRNHMRLNALYIEAADLFRQIRATFGDKKTDTEEAVLARMTAPTLLVIDEAHVRGQTQFENDVLTTIVNKRYAALRETFLVTNETPAEAEKSLGPSIWSRMQECGGLVEVAWTNYRAEANGA